MGDRVRVASLAEVPPGTGRQVHVSGRAVAIYNLGGILHAIDGTCTHRGGPLGEGELVGNVVTCPWHGARFDVTTGAVLGPPAPEGVKSHRVTVEGESIFIELA
jgi:nitrite reductase/ring-hydroxylating ferredoxin subunit